MDTAAIFKIVMAGLQGLPGLFAAAQQIRADLNETDQAALDAVIDEAKASALAHVATANAALDAASQR